jgi:hypothetical protein
LPPENDGDSCRAKSTESQLLLDDQNYYQASVDAGGHVFELPLLCGRIPHALLILSSWATCHKLHKVRTARMQTDIVFTFGDDCLTQ